MCKEVEAVPTNQELTTILAALAADHEELRQQNELLIETNNALAAQRQRYQELFEFAPDAYLVTDALGVIQEANRAAARILNVSQQLLVGKPLVVFVQKERRLFRDQLDRLRQLDHGIKDWEVQFCPRDRECIIMALNVSIVRDCNGEINTLHWLMRDITARVSAAAALRKSEELYRTLADNFPNGGVFLFDHDLRYILASGEGLAVVGLSKELLEGKTIWEALPPQTCEIVEPVYRAALAGKTTTFEASYRDRVYLSHTLPVRNEQGHIFAGMVITQDISDRVRAQQALQASENTFRALIENAFDIVAVVDVHWILHYASPSIERVLGYQQLESIGQKTSDYIHADDLDNVISCCKNVLENPGTTDFIELRILHKNKSWRIFEITISKFSNYLEIPSFVINCCDITERKHAEEIRSNLEKQKALSELQFRFFSLASHEFRNPLSTILFSTQVMELHTESADEKTLRNVQRIVTAAKHMVHLLDDILVISRIETNQLQIKPKLINLEKFCQDLIAEMHYIAAAHTINLHCCHKSAKLDDNLLHYIVGKLLDNAIKYSEQGSSIYLKLTADNNSLILRVRDPGISILPEDLAKIFEPFYRGENVGAIAGAGLGLTVVKKCVDLHGGKITVKSKVGVGTTFTVRLPLI